MPHELLNVCALRCQRKPNVTTEMILETGWVTRGQTVAAYPIFHLYSLNESKLCANSPCACGSWTDPQTGSAAVRHSSSCPNLLGLAGDRNRHPGPSCKLNCQGGESRDGPAFYPQTLVTCGLHASA